ncbi:MAG: hydrogen peroxide-inducible genes activator [Pseudomonadota bacterium]
MRRLPTIKQLQYFVALCELEHFGKSAEACFVSQSAFSTAIKELESIVDAQLVDRTNKHVVITSLGREIASQARMILRDTSMLVESIKQAEAPLSGSLHMGVIPTIAPFLLPELLPIIRKKFPNLRLFLKEEQTQSLYQALMRGELDVLVIAMPYPLRGVEVMNLFSDPFLLACHRDTSLVDATNYQFNRLNSQSIILLEDGHCLRDHAITACKVRSLEKVSTFSATSLLTLIEMINSDLGVSFLPSMARGSPMLKNTNVATHALNDSSKRDIGLAWRSGSNKADMFSVIGETIIEAASSIDV